MIYKVTKQYGAGREMPCDQFKDLASAQAFVQEKIREDISLKIKAIYRIYEWDDLLQAFDSETTEISPQSDGSQGQGKGASFRPTPLNSSPRPPGMPHHWLKDDDKSGKKDS
jgi:hypothetical protein